MNAPVAQRTRRPKWWMLAAAALAILVIGGVAGGLIVDNSESSSAGTANACSATTVADDVLPTVVTIGVRAGSSGGSGSGEVIRSDGYILTNNHVISAVANGGSISVLFSDGTTAPATLTGRDPQTDLAVIKVDVSRSLPVIPFGDSAPVSRTKVVSRAPEVSESGSPFRHHLPRPCPTRSSPTGPPATPSSASRSLR